MFEILIQFRVFIWLAGSLLAFWLLRRLPAWRILSRDGIWGAERDYARWRWRNGLFALSMILTLMALTLVATLRT